MKRQHTYEKIIGNKLNGLTPPDVAGLWDSMEAILDQQMPQQEKRKRGFITWWNSHTNLLAAATLLVVVGGVYTLRQLSISTPVTNTEVVSHVPEKEAAAPMVTSAQENNLSKREAVAVVSNSAVDKERTVTVNSYTASRNGVSATAKTPNKLSGVSRSSEKKNVSADVNKSESAAVVVNSNSAAIETIVLNTEANNNVAVGEEDALLTESAVKEITLVNAALPQVFSLQHVNALTAADLNSKIGKKKKQKIYVDKGVTVGTSMNYTVALNDQVRNSLDRKGEQNKLDDYLPSVYAQLHLSKKFYLQAEWQPVAAQYTPNSTLYRSIVEPSPDEKEEKVVKLNKLYYTNIPVSFHYNTPLKNVTIGVGVQYSLLKKVVLQDQEYYHLIGPGRWDVTERKNEVAVRDPKTMNDHAATGDVVDSVARAFKTEDMRLMADVGYHYKGFNLGMRYTKGLNNYINSNFTNLPVKGRNEAFQVYLRFNLFDSRKK